MTTVSADTEAELVLALRGAGCVFAEDEAALLIAEAGTPQELERMTARRIAGEPLEVIVGWAEFRGLRVAINPNVFVPRHRTEFLVERALQLSPATPVIVDLCCGSGALGLAVQTAIPDATVWAADIEPAAVACARRNLAADRVFQGDLFDALPAELRGTVDLLLVNAPYVPTGEIAGMPPEARDHEPLVALDGGGDGLDVHRRVAAEAAQWLAPGGSLLIEVGESQRDAARTLLRASGLAARADYSEDYDATVVTGTRPAD